MKIDIVSIFPEYLDALNLSLIGKAREKQLLDIVVHNLRDYSNNKHDAVDDSPYGGGAGMVMKVEPWILALEHIYQSRGFFSVQRIGTAGLSEQKRMPTLVIPSPAGALFNQTTARELSGCEHIIFACGRYEGIDERVQTLSHEMFDVRLLSIGDYVINGGEAAALVMVEAITRLIPGVVGNKRSLEEESHSVRGLLEHPVYTKPPQWRNSKVPEVLLSGDHRKILLWRFEQQLLRTKKYRPELFADLNLDDSLGSQQRVIYNKHKK